MLAAETTAELDPTGACRNLTIHYWGNAPVETTSPVRPVGAVGWVREGVL